MEEQEVFPRYNDRPARMKQAALDCKCSYITLWRALAWMNQTGFPSARRPGPALENRIRKLHPELIRSPNKKGAKP